MKANIGLIGLAVMGENLALNMESKGFTVAVYNRSVPGEEGSRRPFYQWPGQKQTFYRNAFDRTIGRLGEKSSYHHDDGQSGGVL